MVPSVTDSPIAGMTSSTVVLTAMSCLDHTASERAFLPVSTMLLDDEADAPGERPEAAHDGDHDAQPERDHALAHGRDADQRDDDPADPVGPPEVELGRVVEDGEDQQREVDR